MLFSSYEFIFLFVPVVLAVFSLLTIAAPKRNVVLFWLLIASLFFYGWWNPSYLPILIGSVLLNFALSRMMIRAQDRARKLWMIGGVGANIALIAYYKYMGFIAAGILAPIGINISVPQVALPLGISFFTFQQIAYLADLYQRKVKESDFPVYSVFVTFFPHLIAGPLVLNNDIADQLRAQPKTPTANNIAAGLLIFSIGLFKKVIIADKLAPFATDGFKFVETCGMLGIEDAWMATLAYTFQLYFDFSGYSDMAFGVAMLFGFRLPQNFNSPYRSLSIIEFWRRWHMTLSHFLRNYIYIPLGGNRKGKMRKGVNLIATMLVGGIWHGAGWNFILWGAWHGGALAINNWWRDRFGPATRAPGKIACYLVTMGVVVTGWVFFRAHSFDGAVTMMKSLGGFANTESALRHNWGAVIKAGLICWLLPNVFDLERVSQKYADKFTWVRKSRDPVLAVVTMVLFIWAVSEIGGYHEFLYFQF